MHQLTPEHLQAKIDFIRSYSKANNPADASRYDANANVTVANIATLEAEINKDIFIQVNRRLVQDSIRKHFNEDLAKEYLRQIEEHEIYIHDESSIKPYCASVTMYPFLLEGLVPLGGESKAPKHLSSFCGSFINLVFALSSQIAGAVATPEFLLYFDYFARKEYGDDYLTENTHDINNQLQHVFYAINQPASARGNQSVFLNVSVFDNYFMESLFAGFTFPDFQRPNFESLKMLQLFFLNWLNEERLRAVLTFPVVTAAMLTEHGRPKDRVFAYDCAKSLHEGNSFFIYMSNSVDSLSSCCRLRNPLTDNTFSSSLGAGGVSTGSVNVITLNLNRLIQKGKDLAQEVEKVQKYQVAYRRIIEEFIANDFLPIYTHGFANLNRQFMTIGINGLAEAAESKGLTVGNNIAYKMFCVDTLKILSDSNREARAKYNCMFNLEIVPAESLGVKNAKWDREDGLEVHRDCYNSYLYLVEDEDTNLLDKILLHSGETLKYLDGGSAVHLNLEDYFSVQAYLNVFTMAATVGCNFFGFNVRNTICNDCGHITKKTFNSCANCGSSNVDWVTRIIGYLKRISSWAAPRIEEHSRRRYHNE